MSDERLKTLGGIWDQLPTFRKWSVLISLAVGAIAIGGVVYKLSQWRADVRIDAAEAKHQRELGALANDVSQYEAKLSDLQKQLNQMDEGPVTPPPPIPARAEPDGTGLDNTREEADAREEMRISPPTVEQDLPDFDDAPLDERSMAEYAREYQEFEEKHEGETDLAKGNYFARDVGKRFEWSGRVRSAYD